MTKKTNRFDWDIYTQLIEEFRDESDRAAVVLGAAKLDLVMYQILKAYLLPCPNSKDELLDGDSPLSTFSSKINILHRLGITGSSFTRALHLIRKIRNSFAHEVSGCLLSTGAHSDRVKELALPLKHIPYFEEFREHFFNDLKGPNIDFRVVLAIMVGRLEVVLMNIESISKEEPLEFINPAWKPEITTKEL